MSPQGPRGSGMLVVGCLRCHMEYCDKCTYTAIRDPSDETGGIPFLGTTSGATRDVVPSLAWVQLKA